MKHIGRGTVTVYRLPTSQELLSSLVAYRYKQVCEMPHHQAHAWTHKTKAEILADIRSFMTGEPRVLPLELKIHPDDYAGLLKRVYGAAVPDPLPTQVMGITMVLDTNAPRWPEIMFGFDLGVV